MWKERLHKFLHWRYGDTFTNILTGAGFLLLLHTVLDYIINDHFNLVSLLGGAVFTICGILYKELVYDKDIEKQKKKE